MFTLSQVFLSLILAHALALALFAIAVVRQIRLERDPKLAERRRWRNAMEDTLAFEIKTDPAPYIRRRILIGIYRNHVLSRNGEDRVEAMTGLVRLALDFPDALWEIQCTCDEKTTLEAARRIRQEILEAFSAEKQRPGAVRLVQFLDGTRKIRNLAVDDYSS